MRENMRRIVIPDKDEFDYKEKKFKNIDKSMKRIVSAFGIDCACSRIRNDNCSDVVVSKYLDEKK